MIHAGFAHIDITPTPDGAGDAFRVYDPIGFRAVVLREGPEAVALITGDFFSFERALLERVCDQLADLDWLPRSHVLASVSHIGGAPVLFQSYVTQPCAQLRMFGQEQRFIDAAARAVRLAASGLAPVRVGAGTASVRGVHYNRRSLDAKGRLVMSNFMLPFPREGLTYAPVDDDVYVLRFDEAGDEYLGVPRGALFAFGCHALCSSDKSGHISADYPGVARRVIEAAWPGAWAAFAPGAIGDVVPFHRAGRTYECVGNAVGGAALSALERCTTRADVTLAVAQRTLALPTFARLPLSLASANHHNDADGATRMDLYAARRHDANATTDYTLTAIRLGEDVLMHLPGEVFVETANAIRRASPLRTTLVLSGPTADVGYLCPPGAHAAGGMEPEFTCVAPHAETVVVRAACELIQSLQISA